MQPDSCVTPWARQNYHCSTGRTCMAASWLGTGREFRPYFVNFAIPAFVQGTSPFWFRLGRIGFWWCGWRESARHPPGAGAGMPAYVSKAPRKRSKARKLGVVSIPCRAVCHEYVTPACAMSPAAVLNAPNLGVRKPQVSRPFYGPDRYSRHRNPGHLRYARATVNGVGGMPVSVSNREVRIGLVLFDLLAGRSAACGFRGASRAAEKKRRRPHCK